MDGFRIIKILCFIYFCGSFLIASFGEDIPSEIHNGFMMLLMAISLLR